MAKYNSLLDFYCFSYDKGIKLNPNYLELRCWKARLLKKLKRYDEALKWLNLFIIVFNSYDKLIELDRKIDLGWKKKGKLLV